MEEFRIVAMTTWKDKIMVASPDSVYEMVEGKPILVAGPADFKRADEEWDRTHEQYKITEPYPRKGQIGNE